jgi:hypothetical protein
MQWRLQFINRASTALKSQCIFFPWLHQVKCSDPYVHARPLVYVLSRLGDRPELLYVHNDESDQMMFSVSFYCVYGVTVPFVLWSNLITSCFFLSVAYGMELFAELQLFFSQNPAVLVQTDVFTENSIFPAKSLSKLDSPLTSLQFSK